VGDSGRTYRPEKEIKEWTEERCPIKTFRERAIKEEIASEQELNLVERDTKKIIREAVDFAIESPYPKEKEVFEDVFFKEKGVEVK